MVATILAQAAFAGPDPGRGPREAVTRSVVSVSGVALAQPADVRRPASRAKEYATAAAPASAATTPDADEASAPTGLTATDTQAGSATLNWVESKGRVTAYRLYEYVRQSRQRSRWVLRIDDIAQSSVHVQGLRPGSLHRYAVTVIDGDGRESHKSAPVTITTLRPPVLYALPTGREETVYAIAGEPFRYALAVIAVPAPRFSLVSGPEGMHLDPVSGVLEWTPPPGAEANATVAVRATNALGEDEQRFTLPVYPIGTDRKPPSPVRQPMARAITENGCTLVWQAASDNVGVVGYLILAQEAGPGHSLVSVGKSQGPATTYTVTGLKAATEYRLWVAAYDAAGNRATVSGIPAAHIRTQGGKGKEQGPRERGAREMKSWLDEAPHEKAS